MVKWILYKSETLHASCIKIFKIEKNISIKRERKEGKPNLVTLIIKHKYIEIKI